ncbi:Dot/Icm T4SS effector AnkK/LegA5 [Legionella maceachernii]|uniref:Cardiac ankyrin repeat-containing protein n=1 Tax=Legionella maceachernii TaxID=466 RepID=A0A0W0WG50_9GAMM|nr:Dot/Icm T4SS effector AnkK/LegA5 [Legionella maceachernii]KTD31304.1 cardiac ankyrin repeat-containing protein [Legionella maceachernii]SKA00119.1 hypothetical protein SAMN02745128_01730 [Legionella maceachernii]SUP01308.1 Uncharacterised protein [Legionella maceachernii]
MSFFYDYNKIALGQLTHIGHTVYKNAKYYYEEGKALRIIFKKNKYNDPQFSYFEAGFTAIASRFLRPHLTPKQFLVKNHRQQVVGLAAEHFAYAAERREGLGNFAEIRRNIKPHRADKRHRYKEGYTIISRTVKKAKDIPISFFDQYPPGFFGVLWEARKRKEIDFDMNSLASVLTSSYTLEEDDLHKGNFGFYLVKKIGKDGRARIVVVFFKIDNDLMMADSVMSRCSSRIVNWRHGDHAFDVTKRDLLSFPKLVDSQNYYWPTSLRFLANPIDNKMYSSAREIQAFTELGDDIEFQQAKWREFYKHILIPKTVIEKELSQVFDKNKSDGRAQIALITHALVSRQAKLRAVLFTIPEFRTFVRTMDPQAITAMQQEILEGMNDESLQNELTSSMDRYQSFSERGFFKGDTPLHIAIRLGDYRNHETWEAFSQFAEVPNARGEKPLDVAVAMMKNTEPHSTRDARKDPYFIIQSLLEKGVEKTNSYRLLNRCKKAQIKSYSLKTIHINKAGIAHSSQAFLEVMQGISEDYSLSLKMKKEIAIVCLKQFIKTQKNNPQYEKMLLEMKEALNGHNTPPAPELQFIRQLRSRLWIIRKIRGLLGGTATQVEFNRLINAELNRLHPSCFSSFSFFCSKSNSDLALDSAETQTHIFSGDVSVPG